MAGVRRKRSDGTALRSTSRYIRLCPTLTRLAKTAQEAVANRPPLQCLWPSLFSAHYQWLLCWGAEKEDSLRELLDGILYRILPDFRLHVSFLIELFHPKPRKSAGLKVF